MKVLQDNLTKQKIIYKLEYTSCLNGNRGKYFHIISLLALLVYIRIDNFQEVVNSCFYIFLQY